MSVVQPQRNSFRASLARSGETPVVSAKAGKLDHCGDGLGQVAVPRSEARRGNHRDKDRHRLTDRQAVVRRKRRKEQVVELVNLSGGGAMVEGKLDAKLWDKLTLVLGQHGEVECAVRWIRGDRYGLEFAHETRIDTDAATLDATLREVVEKSFSEPAAAPEPVDLGDEDNQPPPEPVELGSNQRRDRRHPLIWSGLIHHDHETVVARLRNISEHGALIESTASFANGSEVLLDLGNAGQLTATVCWSRGAQAGVSFAEPFDVRRLAKCPPEVAPSRWVKPDYLADESPETSPWASQWGRLTLDELRENGDR